MDKMNFRVLGALSIEDQDGVEFSLARKHKALLTALTLAGPAGLSREKLVDLFWRDRDEKLARASLRQALTAIRKSLGPYRHCLQAKSEQIMIDHAMIVVDALVFDALASSGNDEDRLRAESLYLGDLLDGVQLKDEGFQDWLQPLRERLRAKVIALLGESLDSAHDAARSIALASRILELDPTDEAAHRALMRTYAAQGRDNAALKQFVICRDRLNQDLGVGPSRHTIALLEEIRNKRRRSIKSTTNDDKPATVQPSPEISEKSTIAVLPFENMSDDPAQAHFAAGMTHDIIQALLRHRWLAVISASNMMRAGSYAMVADGQVIEANVDYLVTGNVLMAGDRLRISIQMVQAKSGEHIWSENYDRRMVDMFEVQDEITGLIAGHIDAEVNIRERQRVLRVPTRNMGAWDCYHLGMAHFLKFTGADHLEAQRLFAHCIEYDPKFGQGHAFGAYMSVLSTFYFDSDPTAELFSQALQAARRAVEIDDQNAMFHMIVARVYLAQREYTKALSEMETAMELNPNLAGIYCGMGDVLTYEGHYEQAVGQFDKALQLGPRDAFRWAYLGYGALTHLFAEKFEAAVDWSEKAIRRPNCLYWAYAHRVAGLGHLGRRDEARNAISELLRIQPRFSRSLAEQKLYFVKRPEQLRIYFEGLRSAGVPQ